MKTKILTIFTIATFYIAGSHAVTSKEDYFNEMVDDAVKFIENQETLPEHQRVKTLSTLLNFVGYVRKTQQPKPQQRQQHQTLDNPGLPKHTPPEKPKRMLNQQIDNGKSHPTTQNEKTFVIKDNPITVACPDASNNEQIEIDDIQYKFECELDADKNLVPYLYSRESEDEKFERVPDELQNKT